MTIEEMKEIAEKTGCSFYNEKGSSEVFIYYPLSMFTEHVWHNSSIMSYDYNNDEIWLYTEIMHETGNIVEPNADYYYMANTLDGKAQKDRPIEEFIEIINKTKQKMKEKQMELKLERVQGDF
jgi:hypothetical protein